MPLSFSLLLLLLLLILLLAAAADGSLLDLRSFGGEPFSVAYDGRSLLLGGRRALLLSGTVFPSRHAPGELPAVFRAAREAGLNAVELPVPWNLHEPAGGGARQWSGRANLTAAVAAAAAEGLFVTVRAGPFLGEAAQWRNGGMPVWADAAGGGGPQRRAGGGWARLASSWLAALAAELAPHTAPASGGPVILAQVDSAADDAEYAEWCAAETAALGLGVPWLMAGGLAGNGTLPACADPADCVPWAQAHAAGAAAPQTPALWAQLPVGGRQSYGAPWPCEEGSCSAPGPLAVAPSPAAVSYGALRFLARGGALVAVDPWSGGSLAGRAARMGAAAAASAYAAGAPASPAGRALAAHLARMFAAVGRAAPALLAAPALVGRGRLLQWLDPFTGGWVNGTQQAAFEPSSSVAVVENSAPYPVLARYGPSTNLTLPAATAVVLLNGTVAFNSSDVGGAPTRPAAAPAASAATLEWRWWAEPVSGPSPPGYPPVPVVTAARPAEQLSVTGAATSFLWYGVKLPARPGAPDEFNVTVDTTEATALMAFVDGVLAASSFDAAAGAANVSLRLGTLHADRSAAHNLTVLSESVGAGGGGGARPPAKGLVGRVLVGGTGEDLAAGGGPWTMRAGLLGEALAIFTEAGAARVPWRAPPAAGVPPLGWYQAKFATPASGGRALLNATGLTRGRLWCGGVDAGRFWTLWQAPGGPQAGPTEAVYAIPADALAPPGSSNLLTVFDADGPVNLGGVSVSFFSS